VGDLATVHKKNWQLPELSGRELKAVKLPNSLSVVQSNYTTQFSRIKDGEFSSTITKNNERFGRAFLGVTFSSANLKQPTHIPKASLPRLPPPVKPIPDSKFFKFLRGWQSNGLNSERLLAVCFLSRQGSVDRVADHVFAEVSQEFRRKKPDKPKAVVPTRRGRKKKQQEMQVGPELVDLAVVDCIKSNLAPKKYNFTNFPMFFFYFGSNLLYASNTFSGGIGKEECLAQLENSLREARAKNFFPENFRFRTRFDDFSQS